MKRYLAFDIIEFAYDSNHGKRYYNIMHDNKM